MLLDPVFLVNNFVLILTVVAIVIAGKGLIFGVLTRLFGYFNIVPLAMGLTMFPIGEFSFVLAGVGLTTGSIGPESLRAAAFYCGDHHDPHALAQANR